MAGPFDFLHIKGRTAGSSNELSFDVLDAARSGLDSQKNRPSRVVVGPKPSQGSYHGVAGTSALSAAPEVARRKRERRAHTARIGVALVIVAITLLGLAGYAGYRFYQEKTSYIGQFNALIDQFVEIDKTIVQVDALMKNPLNAVEAEARADMMTSLPTVSSRLDDIMSKARQLSSNAMGESDKGDLASVGEAAQARKQMIAAAQGAFGLSETVNTRVNAVNSVWDLVIEADMMAREAASSANSASTEEATREARDLTEEALETLKRASEGLTAVEAEIGEEAFHDEHAYIDKRIESLEAAIATADYLLEDNREAAVAANNEYNAADREAANLATALASSPGEVVKGLYSSSMQEFLDAYDTARAAASNADSELRRA